MPDHVPMDMEIPPKHAVASGFGSLTGQSALAIARPVGGKDRNVAGAHFWACGYAVSTVGYELALVN